MISAVGSPGPAMSATVCEQIAEEALRATIIALASPGSWQGIARGLAWRLVAAGERDPRSIELVADNAERALGSLIEDALWALEQTVLRSYRDFLELRPGDQAGALSAARLDAEEESVPLLVAACERAFDSIRGTTSRAA
jgi:hypothetical protein